MMSVDSSTLHEPPGPNDGSTPLPPVPTGNEEEASNSSGATEDKVNEIGDPADEKAKIKPLCDFEIQAGCMYNLVEGSWWRHCRR